MTRAAVAFCLLVVVLFLATPVPAVASGTERCAPGHELRGRLSEHGTTCAIARRVASGYFTESPPGEHVGSLIVRGFYCEGRYRRPAFHISCYRRHARVYFIGTA